MNWLCHRGRFLEGVENSCILTFYDSCSYDYILTIISQIPHIAYHEISKLAIAIRNLEIISPTPGKVSLHNCIFLLAQQASRYRGGNLEIGSE